MTTTHNAIFCCCCQTNRRFCVLFLFFLSFFHTFNQSVLAFARICFEDTYMLIHDTDGQEWADALRRRMHEGNALIREDDGGDGGGGGLDDSVTERSRLLLPPV